MEKETTVIGGVEVGEIKVAAVKPTKTEKVVLKNTAGEDVKVGDYFFNGKPPVAFNQSCGLPVNREDLLDIFNKIFDPKYDFLFYKNIDKELYIVIIPLKHSISVGAQNDSIDGDFQKHALSFLSEGSVNPDTMRMKLRRILPFAKFGDN